MRCLAVLLMPLALCMTGNFASAAPNDCKACRDQQKTCTANYSAQTCKVEYDRCMKDCQKK